MQVTWGRKRVTHQSYLRHGVTRRRLVWRGRLESILLLGVWLGWTAIALGQLPPAEEIPLELEPIVVTGTVAPTLLSQTPASVTILSRDQIAAQQKTSVTDLLRQVPGLHIDQAGGRGGVSSVYLRGGDPNFTAVLIDGVKVNDPTNSRGGAFDFSTLSPEHIERIEIVRGPLSAVYGSDALSGVINIITRQEAPASVRSVDVSGGRFGYVRTIVQAQGMLGEMDYALSGSYLDNGTPVEGSAFLSKTFYANMGVPLAPAMELRGVLRYAGSDSDTFPDDSGGPQFAVRRDVEQREARELTLGFTLVHTPFPWWEYSVQMGLYHRQEDIASPGVAPGVRDPFGIPPSTTDTTLQRFDVTLRHLFTVTKNIRVGVGAQRQFEEGTSMGSLDAGGLLVPTSFALSREIWAPFVELQLSLLPGLLVQGGVRVDLPEGFDRAVSPRVGVSYTLAATGTTLRASWGEGFKLPSFFALSHPLVGNPALVPETSQSVDAGIRQSVWGKRLTVDMAYFYNAFTDLIDFEEGPPPRLVNRSKVTTEGVEMGLRLQPWLSLGVTAHLTYVKTNIQGTNEALRNRPQWRGGFTVQWQPLAGLDVHVQTLVVGDVQDSSIPTGDRTLEAYTRVDLATTWAITPTWQLFVAVDNLFDADYEEFVGFPAPGITPRGGVRARF